MHTLLILLVPFEYAPIVPVNPDTHGNCKIDSTGEVQAASILINFLLDAFFSSNFVVRKSLC